MNNNFNQLNNGMNFDPNTGQPINQPNNGMNFDPNTGQPINQANNGINFDPNTGQPINQPNNGMNFDPQTGQLVNQNYKQVINTVVDENLAKNERACEIGFWLSILGLFLTFLGYTFGVLIYIINFCFAITGLKTSKKKKAIATIVITVISILVVVVQLFGNN